MTTSNAEAPARPNLATSVSAGLPSTIAQLSELVRIPSVSWAAFGTTFGTARATTHLLWGRNGGSGGSGGIVIAGRHVHHFNFGIALLAAVGGVAVHGQEPARRHPLTAAAYGAGAALILDELALLLDLQDVYWAKDGRTSVDAAFGALAVGGLYFASIPFWHGAAREIARTRPST